MIKNNLSVLLGKKRMTQKELADLTGIRPATINEIYHEIALYYSIENIDKICEVLEWDISELFEYVPNKIKKTGENLIKEFHGNRKKY